MFVNQINSEQHTVGSALSVRRLSWWLSSVFLCILIQVGCQNDSPQSVQNRTGLKISPDGTLDEGTIAVEKASKTTVVADESGQFDGPSGHRPSLGAIEEQEQPTASSSVQFLNDRDPLKLPELTDAQLHKNNTLIFLAAQPDLRARKILKPFSKSLTDQEKKHAIKLILAQDYKFLQLKRRRSEILEHAKSGDDIESELKRIDSEIVATSMKLRSTILQSVRKNKIR